MELTYVGCYKCRAGRAPIARLDLFGDRATLAGMRATIFLPLLALVFATGCGPSDSSQSASTTSTNRNMTNDGAFGQYVGGLAQAKQDAGKAVDISSLKPAIDQFFVDKGRYPSDLNELITEKYITKVPQAPYGMKIDYDAATGKVQVVNQ